MQVYNTQAARGLPEPSTALSSFCLQTTDNSNPAKFSFTCFWVRYGFFPTQPLQELLNQPAMFSLVNTAFSTMQPDIYSIVGCTLANIHP